MDIERSIDGMVGRMLSWLTLTPMRPRREAGEESLSVTEQVEDAAEVVRRTAEKIGEEVAAVSEAVSDVVFEQVDAVSEAVIRREKEVAVEAGEPDRDAPDPLERRILEALVASEGGAAIKDLQRSTGGKPTTLRARLNRLIGSGRVQRRGQGMRTRYHLAAKGPGDG